MMKHAVAVALLFAASVAVAQQGKAPAGPPPPPPPRAIPGLTAPDPHPNGCVDCHVNMKDFDLDVRISTLMGKWQQGEVEPKLMAATKASAPDSTKIKGRHPKVATRDIPGSCLTCHGRNATAAPPFARLVHRIHLVGGEQNLYMGYYQGDCTHCHKLDPGTGRWRMPSGPEPAGD